jgi:hypothetical protein
MVVTNKPFEIGAWNLVQSIIYEMLFVSDNYENDCDGGGDDLKLWSYIWQM